MSVAPLSDLQRNEGEVRWAETWRQVQLPEVPVPSATVANLLPHTQMWWSEAQTQRVPVAGADTSRCVDTARWS